VLVNITLSPIFRTVCVKIADIAMLVEQAEVAPKERATYKSGLDEWH
jgi:hypothetical protein